MGSSMFRHIINCLNVMNINQDSLWPIRITIANISIELKNVVFRHIVHPSPFCWGAEGREGGLSLPPNFQKGGAYLRGP